MPNIVDDAFQNRDIVVAHAYGDEDAGYVAIKQGMEYGEIDYINVHDNFRGVDDSQGSVANKLFAEGVEKIINQGKVPLVYCNAGNGKIQHMAEKYGMDVSGLKVQENISDGLTPIMQEASNDFTEVKIFLSPEVEDAAEAAAPPNTGLDYSVPGAIEGCEIFYDAPRKGSSNSINAEVVQGTNNVDSIVSELESLEDEVNPEAWGYSVDFDATDPVAYPLSQDLSNNGWNLVNLQKNGEATMLKLNREIGPYGLTSKTQEFIDDVGLPYAVEAEGSKSNQIVFAPEDSQIETVSADSMVGEEVLRPTRAD